MAEKTLGLQGKKDDGSRLGFQPIAREPERHVPGLSDEQVALLERLGQHEIAELRSENADVRVTAATHCDVAVALWAHLRDAIAYVRTLQPPDSRPPENVEAAALALQEYESYAAVVSEAPAPEECTCAMTEASMRSCPVHGENAPES